MPLHLGNPAAPPLSGVDAATAAPPAAVRVTRPGWRDPRLWVGIAIVAACVVAGARVLGAADDAVPVWALKADAGAGAVLTRSDLEVHRVHVDTAGDLAAYFRADADLPAQFALARPIGHGELLPRSALATAADSDTVQLPLAVDPAQVPPSVTSGSVVDVYVVGAGADAADSQATATGQHGQSAGRDRGVATPALSAVTVVAAPRSDDGFGSGQTKRELTLAVPDTVAQTFFALLGGLSDPTLTVVLRPAG